MEWCCKILLLVCVLTFAFVQGVECRRRRRIYKECKERNIAASEDMSNVVVSAKVERVMQAGDTVSVRVKRVFKGPPALNGSVLLVQGLLEPEWCDARLRDSDTRIFLLQEITAGKLRVVASPVRITVPNLEKVEAAVKDEPVRRRVNIWDLPCEAKYCPYNADCSADRRGSTTCHCPESCPFDPYAVPVCGSDQRSYSNHCRLRIESCRRQQIVWVYHEGACHIPSLPY